MTSTREQLKEAYRLIRQDQPQAAQAILRPILEENPDNAHAWWLLAYSVDDPYEVRDALNKVLEIDPNYSNADKAREMLQTLEEQFFNPPAADAGAAYLTEEYEAASDDDSESFLSSAFDYEEDTGFEDYGTVSENLFEEDETFLSGYDEDASEADEDGALGDLFAESGDMSQEDKAAAEEREGKKAGRGRRIFTLLLLIVLLVVIAGGVLVLVGGDEDANDDPGALQAVEVAPGPVADVVDTAERDISGAGVGEQQQALVAETSMGQTLFIEFCREPSRDLPQDISLAMHIAAQQAVNVAEDIDAVGISVNRCNAEPHDTLYRAFVSVEDAVSYINSGPGNDQAAWIEFQRRWQKP